MKESVEVHFEKPVYGGECKGSMPDGRTVFTPFVLSGETAEVTPYFERKGYVKAELNSLIAESPARIKPRCQHFGVCGGCHYQITAYPNQLEIKQAIVADQLERIGGIKDPPVRAILPAEPPFNYRNSIQFQVTPEGKLGFFHHSGKYVIPVDECHLPSEEILQLWKQLNLESFPDLRHVQFRAGADGDQMVILESDDIKNLPEIEVDLPVSVVHFSPAGTIVMAGDDHLIFEVKQKSFKVSAQSFFQVNSQQAERLIDQVLEFIPQSGFRFLELYSGVGLFTAFIAPRFQEIVAIEESESACNDFAANLDQYDHISLYVGSMNAVLPGIDGKFDCVLLDPPRSGVDEWSMAALLALKIPSLVYVSCDIATLARDLKILMSAGYRLNEVVPLDMFPQTYHVETVVMLEKR
jgi:23S rRNA (uracil1939-C5)-methyltransferase